MMIIAFRCLGNSLKRQDTLANRLPHFVVDCVAREER